MQRFLQANASLILRMAHGAAAGRRGVDAEDVAQEVVLALLRSHRAGAFDPARIEHPEGYLRVVVANAARRAFARRRPDAVVEDEQLASMADEAAKRGPDSSPTIEDVTQRALDSRRRIDELKSRLRPRDAAAFALLVEDGLSIDEVATALGTTPNNVYQMRHRILAAARELEPSSVRTDAVRTLHGTETRVSTDDRADLRHLERAAAASAPSIPDGPHVRDAELARVRAGDEDPALDAAYLHLSRCAACRQALATPTVAAERERDAVREHDAALAELRRSRRRVIPMWAPLAAAAVVALGVGVSLVGGRDGSVAITQRPIAGWMGDHAGPAVDPADANLEVRVTAPRFPAAALIACDDRGRVLMPPASFSHDAKGDLVAVVAPRTFSPHSGPAIGLVVLASDEGIRRLVTSDAATAGAPSPEALAAALSAGARSDAHVERITLGATN